MGLNGIMEKRRSIRAYKDGAIERGTLEELIAAAQEAPSWKNSQTGRYYVVTDPEMLARVRSECLPARNADKCAGAPVLIVTAFEKGISGFTNDAVPENELGDEWGAYDLGLQNENLVLKAAELGLGTLIMGLRDARAIRSLLGIPESQEIAAVISVGYPAVEPKKPARKDPCEITRWF